MFRRILMVKKLVAVLLTLSAAVAAQEEVKLPEFNTFFSFVNTGNRGDISMSEASGLSARLKMNNTRCFLDEVVTAQDKGDDLVIKVDLKPVVPNDLAYCKIAVTITMPKQTGAFGRTSKMEWVYARLNGHVAHARFSIK
jgi:hypothetical protein